MARICTVLKENKKRINEQINVISRLQCVDDADEGWVPPTKSGRRLPYTGDRTAVKRGNARAVRACLAHGVWMQHSCTTY